MWSIICVLCSICKDICLFDFVFFFQAEDGIRDAQESRGLGDVYKRQDNTMAEMHKDQEFLEYVVKSLVDSPEDVKVDRKVDEMGVLMTLEVNPVDMGKIIGRQGNTAKAIRTLLRVVGMKFNARVNLKINEPVGAANNMATSSASRSVDQAMEDLKQI